MMVYILIVSVHSKYSLLLLVYEVSFAGAGSGPNRTMLLPGTAGKVYFTAWNVVGV